MKRAIESVLIMASSTLLLLATGCNDFEQFAGAYQITDRVQLIGGSSALADLDDFIIENDKIRLAIPERGNSTGPGVFGGSLLDADRQRYDVAHRGGRGLDQFTEMFPIGNLTIPSICLKTPDKEDSFCELPRGAVRPSIRVLCDGRRPCLTCSGDDDCKEKNAQIDLSLPANADYADSEDPTKPGPEAPGEGAAIIRTEGQAGNYLEALGLMSLVKVKLNFRFRNDFILEPGVDYVRIRTMLTEVSSTDGGILNKNGEVRKLPPLTGVQPLFGLLLGSGEYTSDFPDILPGAKPGVAGGDFLFFGDRMKLFAPGIGFDIYRNMREKFAVGMDLLNNPVAADFLVAVGQNVSYAIASPEPGGKYLLPIFSGAVTAGFSHGAHCYDGPCPGTPEQCANVLDCTQVRSYVYERIFAVGEGDVASATQSIYKVRGVVTGRVSGHVLDARSGKPVTLAGVHVYPVPENMAECRRGGNPDTPYTGGAEGFIKTCLEPRHFAWAINHMRTDRRATDLPEGYFEGAVPVGKYYLLAKKKFRSMSRIVPVEVRADETTQASLALPPPARLAFDVRDQSNQHLPSKITIGQCLPNCSGRYVAVCQDDFDCESGKCIEDAAGTRRCLVDNCSAKRACNLENMRCELREACAADGDCESAERCMAGRCVCEPTYMRLAALGEGTFPLGIGRYTYTGKGQGEVEVEPGSWEAWASRGFEYSVDKQQFEALGGHKNLLSFRINRVVDTSGWISSDFHVHGQNSYDGITPHKDRVTCFAGEGVEMLSTSDHDWITNLYPWVLKLGMEKWVNTQIGLELTTVEIGHWLAFPLKYAEWRDGDRLQEQGAVDWTGKLPDRLEDELRGLGLYGSEDTVVIVAHPRDYFFGYFYQFGLDSYNVHNVKGNPFESLIPGLGNPLADPKEFSGRFDGLELFNSKRYELIRTPMTGEIRAYSNERAAVQSAARQGVTPEVIERNLIALGRKHIKDILRRTPAEQDAIWESDGSQGCDVLTFCAGDDDCEGDELCDQTGSACYLPCGSPDCHEACVDGKCDKNMTPVGQPCTNYDGAVDDWFRLIDAGVVRVGIGNSDSHQLFTQTEGGLPHNFVRMNAESPKGIDQLELARAVKGGRVVASYGPFIEAWLGDAAIGDTFSMTGSQETVPLRIRVQSPSWFDVDRVEVYRSGRLAHVFTGQGDELNPDSRVDTSGLRLPNKGVVNLDVTIEEQKGERDDWFVVIAMGLDGRNLSPVYAEHPYLKLLIGDILSRSFGSLASLFPISGASIPRVFKIYPYAVANPVFLDIDGNGVYDAPGEKPEWAEGGASFRGKSSALSSSDLTTDPQIWRARQTQYFLSLIYRVLRWGED